MVPYLGTIKSNGELSHGGRWKDAVYHRMPASRKPQGQVSPKWGGDERADVPAISPVSFDINAAAYYGISLILRQERAEQ